MVNETSKLPMTKLLLNTDSANMLNLAKARGLVIPLKDYTIRVCGVSTTGVTAAEWITVRGFWLRYFETVGASSVSYSVDCDTDRLRISF